MRQGNDRCDVNLYHRQLIAILTELNCAPSKLLHLGDNRLSDVAVPSSWGIRTLLLSTEIHRFKRHRRLSDGAGGSLALSGMFSTIARRWQSLDEAPKCDGEAVSEDDAMGKTASILFLVAPNGYALLLCA